MDEASPELIAQLEASRRDFLAAVEGLRPDLHRYCARMTGSVIDGEDVVQEVLARAYFELPTLKQVPSLRSWLFRIAHNRAIDYTRRHERRLSDPLDTAAELPAEAPDPEGQLAHDEALRAAVSRFLELPSAQRSSVILKDVLGHSVPEIAELLRLSEAAISSALHRGRARLRELGRAAPAPPPAASSPVVARYAELFNARDWDGVRALLAGEVEIELVSRWKPASALEGGTYFTNYSSVSGWRLVPGSVDGRAIIGVYANSDATLPTYLVEVTITGGLVSAIRDYRYVSYIARDSGFVPAVP
jgi:RNA polymerase sigma-70 factor (ECF subfamily)